MAQRAYAFRADLTVRSVTASREWTRAYAVDFEHTTTESAGLAAGPLWLTTRVDIESAVQRTYSIDTTSKLDFSEQITITVPAGVRVRVTMRWKRIWQHGVVRIADHRGEVSTVPFQVVANVTFDQRQTDIT